MRIKSTTVLTAMAVITLILMLSIFAFSLNVVKKESAKQTLIIFECERHGGALLDLYRSKPVCIKKSQIIDLQGSD